MTGRDFQDKSSLLYGLDRRTGKCQSMPSTGHEKNKERLEFGRQELELTLQTQTLELL